METLTFSFSANRGSNIRYVVAPDDLEFLRCLKSRI